MISELSIVTQYARGLYNAASNKNKLNVVKTELITLQNLLTKYPEKFLRISAEITSHSNKRKIFSKLAEIYSFDSLVLNLLLTASLNNRLPYLNKIIEAFLEHDQTQNNIVSGLIISAAALDQKQREKLSENIQQQLKKKLLLEYQVDPEILGGVIIQIGMLQIDNSIRNKLQRFKINTQNLY